MRKVDFYLQIIEELIKKHKIKIIEYTSTNSGTAHPDKREITIPFPSNINRFVTCIHEIGHVVRGNMDLACLDEFEAIMYARGIFQQYKLKYPHKEYKRDVEEMKYSIAFDIFMRNLSIKDIPKKVINFSDIDVNEWKKNLKEKKIPVAVNTKDYYSGTIVEWIDSKIRNSIVGEFNFIYER